VAFATLGGSESTVPIVPKAAVQSIGNQQVVFVATKEANVFAMRPVRPGAETNGFFPILEGLAVGEKIVTDGSFLLRAEWLKLHPAH
jgi:multidrug efflux pump subunit AcrA (membrane-fusion protein)